MEKIVGIDFGTTNTVVAYTTLAGPKAILDHRGSKLTPSVVAKQHGKLLVGREAKDNADAYVNGTGIKEVKRQIGTKQRINFAGESLYPHEVAAIILKKVKRNADLHFGESVTKAVITVPAEFSDAQRQEIIEAGKIAGFEVAKIINEPTAALMTYAYENYVKNETVLCYDFGGGTFDVSIADVSSQEIKVRGVGGDRQLGGSDIDKTLLTLLKNEVEKANRCTLSKHGDYTLSLEVEKLKIALSTKDIASIGKKLMTTSGRGVYFTRKMTRNEFNQIIGTIIDKTIQKVKDVLKENHLQPGDIDTILLVGGSSQIPIVRSKLSQLFKKSPISNQYYSDGAVALGAALEAANRTMGRNSIGPSVEDVSPYTIGLKVNVGNNNDYFDPIIHKNYPYNREYPSTYYTSYDNQYAMILDVYQGESQRASQNEHITKVEVKGIPEREAEKEAVKVSFMYDENGIIHIKARILSTGRLISKEIKYKRAFTQRETDQSKDKIDDHFMEDESFEQTVILKELLKKHKLMQESKDLEDALKEDDDQKVEKLKKKFLD